MPPYIFIETRIPIHFLTQPEVAFRLPTGGGASLTHQRWRFAYLRLMAVIPPGSVRRKPQVFGVN
jgi:hypothetical protein